MESNMRHVQQTPRIVIGQEYCSKALQGGGGAFEGEGGLEGGRGVMEGERGGVEGWRR